MLRRPIPTTIRISTESGDPLRPQFFEIEGSRLQAGFEPATHCLEGAKETIVACEAM